MEKSFGERVQDAKQVVPSVSPEEAHQLGQAETVKFIDPRPADAIASTTGLIPGAFNITLGDIASGNLPAELADKSTQIITACQGGPMGAVAAHELAKQGYTQVRYVDGGTQGWLDAGFPTKSLEA